MLMSAKPISESLKELLKNMKTQRETPDFVCQKLISKLPITDRIRIIEPSIGEGKIIHYLFDNYNLGGVTVVGIELNKERITKAGQNLTDEFLNSPKQRHVQERNNLYLYQEDFLKNSFSLLKNPDRKILNTSMPFDVAIACPPFKNNLDLAHIQLMYDSLKHKGMMASLTSPYWMTNNEPHQIEFRKWLESKDYQLEMLPDNTFIERDKTVPTAIITIYKR
jgi:hypothetical protein